MSRRRSNDPSVIMSVSIPRSLDQRLLQLLAYNQSRSRWVCNAIRAKLDAHDAESQVIDNLTSRRLVVLLFNRGIIDYAMMQLLTEKCPTTE